ncbi:MAG: 6-pyruvoyl-tetrahydropterin synthase-related protein [Chloroflexota bacterium]
MRASLPAVSRVSKDLLALFVLVIGALPAVGPLLQDGVPATHDGHLHVQRLIALDELNAQSVLLARWLPSVSYGLGAPVFNYYAPLAYLPALTIRALGADLATSYKLAFGLPMVLSGLAGYALARVWTDRVSAIAAGLVLAYAPYQLVNVYVRGALAEAAAAPLLAAVAATTVATIRTSGTRWLIAHAAAMGALVLTHNITALVAVPMFATIALAVTFGTPDLMARRSLARFATATGLGVALAGAYWLPALAERSLVHIQAAIEPELFASFFLAAQPWAQTSFSYDYLQPVSSVSGTDIYWPRMGLAQLGLFLIAGIVAAARRRTRATACWALAIGLASIALQLAPTRALYEIVPLAAFIQFPWRLLAVFGLATALLTALAINAAPSAPGARPALVAGVVACSAATSLWQLNPSRDLIDPSALTPETITRIELGGMGVGTTHGGEYLAASTPAANATRLWKDLRDLDTARGHAEPPVGLAVESLSWSTEALRTSVTASAPERLTIRQSRFEGWQILVDGVDAPPARGPRIGQLAVLLSPGAHDVEFRFGWTAWRIAGVAVTGVAIAGCVFLVRPRRSLTTLVLAGALLLASGCLRVTGSPDVPVRDEPSAEIRLLGVRADTSSVHRDGRATLYLHWLATAAPREQVTVWVGPVDERYGAPGRWAHTLLVRTWERGELVTTPTSVWLSPGATGEIAMRATLRRPDGALLREIELPPLRIERPSTSSARPTVNSEDRPLPTAQIDRVIVDGREASRLTPGAIVDVDLSLAVARPATSDLLAAIELTSPRGGQRSELATLGGWYSPPASWRAGQELRQRLRMTVSDQIGGGDVELSVLVYSAPFDWSGLAPYSQFAPRARGEPELRLVFPARFSTP